MTLDAVDGDQVRQRDAAGIAQRERSVIERAAHGMPGVDEIGATELRWPRVPSALSRVAALTLPCSRHGGKGPASTGGGRDKRLHLRIVGALKAPSFQKPRAALR